MAFRRSGSFTACANDHAPSCFLLGRIKLADKDPTAAVGAFSRAARNDPAILRDVGLRFAHKHRYREALSFLVPSCRGGDRYACDAEGRVSVIVGQTNEHVVALLRDACLTGVTHASCRALSFISAKRGNYILAKRYYALGQPAKFDEMYRAALMRSLDGKGSTVDDLTTGATFVFPLLAVLAIPTPDSTGYGFELDYPDP